MNNLESGNHFCSISEHKNRGSALIKKTMQTSKDLETSSGVIQPPAGSWQARKLLKPTALLRWGLIAIEPSGHGKMDYVGIISLIEDYGREMGMTVAQPVVQQFYLQLQDLMSLLMNCKEKDIKILFVVIPSEKDYYHKEKQMADREVGIMTQCTKEQTARKFMRLCITKSIMLKVNSKLISVNQTLDSSSMPSYHQGAERVLVVGGHDTHQSPKQKKLIVELEDMMVKHLNVSTGHNRPLPTKIFYFRNAMFHRAI